MIGYVVVFLLGVVSCLAALAGAVFFGLKLGTKKFQKGIASRGQTAQLLQLLHKPDALTEEEKALLVEAWPQRLKDRPFERALHPSRKRKPDDPSIPRVRVDREALTLVDSSVSTAAESPAGSLDSSGGASSAPSSSTSAHQQQLNTSTGQTTATGSSSVGSLTSMPSSVSLTGNRAGTSSPAVWQARTGMLYVRVVGVWKEMFVVVGRKRLYYCFPPTAQNPKPTCVGAVRLDNVDVSAKAKTVKKERWGRMDIATVDKKQRLFVAVGMNGERLKYPKGKSSSNHLFLKSKDEADIYEWRKCIVEQMRLPASVEPDDAIDDLNDDTPSLGNDVTAADDLSEEDDADTATADSFTSDDPPSSSSSSRADSLSGSVDISEVPLLQRGFVEIKETGEWRRRYFVISRGVMTFFKSDKNLDEMLGIIKPENDMVVETVELDDVDAARSKKERCYGLRIRHPELRRIFCLTKPNGTKLPSAKDHANDYECYLRVGSEEERRGWMVSIAHAIKTVKPNDALLGVPVIAAGQPFEPIPFFRLLMARNWDDMVRSPVFKQNVLDKIKKQIAEIQLPKFINSIRVSNLDIGSRFVDFDSYRYRTVVTPRTRSLEIVIDVNLSYAGGLFIELNIEALLKIAGKSIVVPIRVHVQLLELTGMLTCFVPASTEEKPAPKWSVFFPETPHFKWKLNLTILSPIKSSREYTISKFAKVRNFLETALEHQICSALVWPSSMTFHIPFPGRKLGIKLEKVTSTVSAPKDGQRRQAPNVEESASIVTMKYIIGRVLDELINNWNQSLIPELFMPTGTIYGLNPFYDGAYTGFQGVQDAIGELMAAFSDLKITIVDQSVEGSNIHVRFNLRGIHTGDFWESPPTGKRILLHGMLTARIRQALVDVLRFYWDPASIYALL